MPKGGTISSLVQRGQSGWIKRAPQSCGRRWAKTIFVCMGHTSFQRILLSESVTIVVVEHEDSMSFLTLFFLLLTFFSLLRHGTLGASFVVQDGEDARFLLSPQQQGIWYSFTALLNGSVTVWSSSSSIHTLLFWWWIDNLFIFCFKNPVDVCQKSKAKYYLFNFADSPSFSETRRVCTRTKQSILLGECRCVPGKSSRHRTDRNKTRSWIPWSLLLRFLSLCFSFWLSQ